MMKNLLFSFGLGLLLFVFTSCSTHSFRGESKSDTQKRTEEALVAKWKETSRLVIEQRGEDVRICGDKHPEAYKNYSKNLVRIEFTVVGEGVVQKIRTLQNTTGSKGIETCLLDAFKTTKFNPIPKHVTSMVINFPFEFKTGAQTIQ